jgi:DNA repair exonuclease SbcCD ATPase subunit
MMTESDKLCPLAEKIAEMETKLEALGREIDEIGMPAAYDLKKRYDALRIEENALKRNFEESTARGEPDAVRLEKIEALLRHIEREEASVEHEAHFLHQSNPSSVILAAQAATGMVELWRKAIKKVLGDVHPLGQSVFVNHTHDNLTEDHGLDRDEPKP